MNSYVFIYGTLKRGKCNNHVMGSSRFVQEAHTKPLYKLFFGMFPYLVPSSSEEGVSIKGEIWEVTPEKLQQLDRFEGHPQFYKREEIEIEGFDHKVEAYFYQGSIKQAQDCGKEWK